MKLNGSTEFCIDTCGDPRGHMLDLQLRFGRTSAWKSLIMSTAQAKQFANEILAKVQELEQ